RPRSRPDPQRGDSVALDPPRVTATTPGIAASCAARCSMTGVFPAGPGRGRPLATGSTDPAARRAGRAVPDAASAHRGREPEDREQAGAERGDLPDQAAVYAQHIDLERPVYRGPGPAHVACRGPHPVRRPRHQAPVALPFRAEGTFQQWRDRVEAVVAER